MLNISPKRVRFCAALICFVCGLAIGYPQTAQEEAQRKQRIDQLRKGVIKVTAFKPGDVLDVGAGIMLGEQEGKIYFLTAFHIIEDASEIQIESYGKRGKQIRAEVFGERYSPDHDIAVLVVSSYEISDYVEQLYEVDLSKLQPGDKTIIIGHPPDKEWELASTPLRSMNSTRLILNQGVVQPSHSGGPLLDIYGNLVGVVIGNNETEYGEVVRIDTALTILNEWGVPYRTKLRVDFCALINRIIESSRQDYDDMKGMKSEEYKGVWELNDRSLDLTGVGRSRLVSDVYTSRTKYVANFGRQRDETEARRVWNQVAQQVVNCIPGGKEKAYQEGEYCWRAAYRKKMFRDPIQFVIHLTLGDEVELYMYRGYDFKIFCKGHRGYGHLFGR